MGAILNVRVLPMRVCLLPTPLQVRLRKEAEALKSVDKAKQAKAATSSSGSKGSSKGISKSTAVSKPRRGGGASIVSVPGLSKKEVAALNKAARASAKRMAADSDSDDMGYSGGLSGLKGRSAAFWEKELL